MKALEIKYQWETSHLGPSPVSTPEIDKICLNKFNSVIRNRAPVEKVGAREHFVDVYRPFY